MAILYRLDGTTDTVRPAGKYFTLEELYALVGTDTVEVLYLAKDNLLVFCENGKLLNKPSNTYATLAAKALGWRPSHPLDIMQGIVGTALLCSAKELD